MERKNISKVLLAQFLILSINIINSNWEEVYEILDLITTNLENLSDHLDENMKKINNDYSEKFQVDYRQILISRGYLLHWSLFLLKENKTGIEKYLHLIFNEKNLTILDNSFRSLIKYAIVLVLITKSRKNISILKQTFFNSNSNISSFTADLDKSNECYYNLFDSLFLNFNIDNVMVFLSECKKVYNNVNK